MRHLALALAAALALPWAAHAQRSATVTGTVTDAAGRPLGGAQVFLVGTSIGTVTNAQGRYTLTVPPGSHTLHVRLVGYAEASRSLRVEAGQTLTVNVQLQPRAIELEELVVAGVAEATRRAVLPITVNRVSAEQIQVPTTSAAAAIQGKVPGATVIQASGRPGSAPTILLRTPKSINASGRSQSPLFIVDGVIVTGGTVDLDALDIESIEVIPGAAAASYYGSRAQNGVVQITTRRGRDVANNSVRYTARSEFGRSYLPGRFNLTLRHQFAMTPDSTKFLDAAGNPCDWLMCPSVRLAGQFRDRQYNLNAQGQPVPLAPGPWNTVQRERWPGRTYDQVREFFTDGPFQQHYVGVDGRAGATNFHASYAFLRERGVMPGQDGFRRHTFRLNVDQAVRPQLSVSASAFFSRSNQDLFPESQGNPMFNLTRMPAGVNLRACEPGTRDAQGNPIEICAGTPYGFQYLLLRPDPFNENPNPLYELYYRQYDNKRSRFLGNATVRWSPLSWFSVDGSIGYDRLDYNEQDYLPKGYRTLRPDPTTNSGTLYRYSSYVEGLNVAVTGTFRWSLGDLDTRSQLRYLWEQEDNREFFTSGWNFRVADVPEFGNIVRENLSAGSSTAPVRSDGYYALTNLTFRDRYILDALVRNDGSSLFGPNQRRHWYYRVAGAYRLGQEPFLRERFGWLDELKLRAAVGTAGGRPSWSAQYETFVVDAQGVRPVTLGNRDLRPEKTTEREYAVDVGLFGRLAANVTYAHSVTTDQILLVPQPAYRGFTSRWENAGTLEGRTWEASLDLQLLQRRNLAWSVRLTYDRTRQRITELGVPPYTTGVGGQGLGSVFYIRKGEELGTFYGTLIATKCEHLPLNVQPYCNQFAVNRDGLLVWVGPAGSPRNGWQTYPITDAQGRVIGQRTWWGTQAPPELAIRGVRPMWGEPIQGECTDRVTGQRTTYCPLGKTTPDYKLGLSTNLSIGRLQIYGLLESVQGISVYNQPLQWAVFQNYAGIMDQSRYPEEDQYPLGYYARLYGVSGLAPSSFFVQDGSFVKLRELSVRWRVPNRFVGALPVLRGTDGLTLSLIGRNLKTWTKYDGYDPETGRGGGGLGSAALARVDGYNYPPFRTVTFGVEVTW